MSTASTRVSHPTARVGLVGGGQLARMGVAAATALGIELHVLDDASDAPAVQAGAHWVEGSYRDYEDLLRLASHVDVMTFDHELADADALAALAEQGVQVRPSPTIKRLAQDKLHARRVLGGELGFPVPAYAEARSADDIAAFGDVHGWPVVAKAITGGYDGRGVCVVADRGEADQVIVDFGAPVLVEEHIAIDQELAVLVARAAGTGEVRVYPTVETVQRDGICHEAVLPARVEPSIARAAQTLAVDLANALELEGLLAVELFRTGDRLVLCELALRPHNSGHVTLDGCVTSQFEQHLRAVLGWPLGDTSPLAAAAAMVNILGPADGSDPADRVPAALAIEGAHLHLYGKQARPGRKLGHVTTLGPDPEAALRTARAAVSALCQPSEATAASNHREKNA